MDPFAHHINLMGPGEELGELLMVQHNERLAQIQVQHHRNRQPNNRRRDIPQRLGRRNNRGANNNWVNEVVNF